MPVSLTSLTHRVKKGGTCPTGLGSGKHALQVWGGETCPAVLGRWKHALA